MSHPCHNFRCPEWNQGECFGDGCRRNPAPQERDGYETENEGETEND